MATPKTRNRFERQPRALTPKLTMGRTARELLADRKGRVLNLTLIENDTAVLVVLNEGWRWANSAPTGDVPSFARRFTLWEAARNAVRRAVKVKGGV